MRKEDEKDRIGNFEEAEDATRALFEGQEQEEEATVEGTVENDPQGGGKNLSLEQNPVQEETEAGPADNLEGAGNSDGQPENPNTDVTEQAVQTAEQAAGLAQQKDAQLQQAMQELQALKAQNAQLMEAITQMSDVQRENLTDEAMKPPVLELSRLAYDDDETINQKQAEYAERMAQYVMQQMSKTMEPLMQQAQAGKEQKERADVIWTLEQMPQLTGFREMLPQIERVIQNNDALFAKDAPLAEKYITAYAITKGIDTINHPPKEPTAQELMNFYESNPEFQELLEKKRLEHVKGKQQIPPLSASSGSVNAALNIPEEPKTFAEASERTRKMFGL